MAQQVGTIFGSPKSAAVVGNLITGAGSYAGNEISDLGMEAGAVTKSVGTYTADDIKRNTAVGGMLAKEIIRDENVRGTKTNGVGFSASLGPFAVDGSMGLAFDLKGNIGLQYSGSWGFTTEGNSSASIYVFNTITSAKDISSLTGDGMSIGGSYTDFINEIPVYAGIDIQAGGNIKNKPSECDYGFTSAIGIGTPGKEGHVKKSYTREISSCNVIDWTIEKLGIEDK